MQHHDSEEPFLIGMPDNPVPPGAICGRLPTPDGYSLRYARFLPEGRPLQGTVIILHGRNECIEKYFETVGDLSRRGFAAATFDWRGQGGSDRILSNPVKGYIDGFDTYVADLEQFFEDVVLPDCRGPYFVLGHSTGSLVALLAAPMMANRVRRMVLAAPMLGLDHPFFSQKSIAWVARAMTMLGMGSLYLAGGPRPREIAPFATNKLTTDHGRYMRNARLFQHHPELALGGPTASWVNAAVRAIGQVGTPEFVASIHIPTLMVAAGADTVVSTRAIEEYAMRMRSGAVVTIDGARHELMQEADLYREQFLGALFAFIPGEGAA